MQDVVWAPMANFEGLYEISSSGDIRSVAREFSYYDPRWGCIITRKHKSAIMKQFDRAGGYKFVSLRRDGEYYQRYVHRLVAQTFIPNPENKPEVNHKDGDKTNNTVSNLEWVTPHENQLHSHLVLGHPSSMKGKHHSLVTRQKISLHSQGNSGYAHTAETRAKFIKSRCTPVICVTDGKMFACAKDADRYYGYSQVVSTAIRLGRSTRDGRRFEYISKEKYYAIPV